MGSDPRTHKFEVVGEWFADRVDRCTCAGGTAESSYAHEHGCGLEPLAKLSDVEAALDAHYRKAGVVRLDTRDEATAERVAAAISPGATQYMIPVARAVLAALVAQEDNR